MTSEDHVHATKRTVFLMPIENELPFAIPFDSSLLSDLQNDLHSHDLEQKYLNAHVRIRKSSSLNGTSHFLTYKTTHPRRGLIEIETEITPRDYTDLIDLATRGLRKTRFKINRGQNHWDIDFIRDADGHYAAVRAEVEMPEGVDHPDLVPWFIYNYTIDGEPPISPISNYSLTDPDAFHIFIASLALMKPRTNPAPFGQWLEWGK